MNKRSHNDWKKSPNPDPSETSGPVKVNSRRIKLWQAIITPGVSLLVFFLLVEGVLALFGVKPVIISEDPFVGFTANAPLFIPVPGPQGSQLLTMAENKLFSYYMPSYDRAHEVIGYIMTKRGRLDIACASMREALRLNPKNTQAKENLTVVRKALWGHIPDPKPPQVVLDLYPSRAPLALVQVRSGPDGHPVVDGIKAEFHENGRLKYFADIAQGKLNGIEMTWDPDSQPLSRKTYKNGVLVD